MDTTTSSSIPYPSSDTNSRLRHHHNSNNHGMREEDEDCGGSRVGGHHHHHHNKRRCGEKKNESDFSPCPRVCHHEKSNKPICGSDRRLYASHCDLRRWSCLKKSHIHPVNHSFCLHNNHHHFMAQLSSSLAEHPPHPYLLQPLGSFSFLKRISHILLI
jgi:hypothetical protein